MFCRIQEGGYVLTSKLNLNYMPKLRYFYKESKESSL